MIKKLCFIGPRMKNSLIFRVKNKNNCHYLTVMAEKFNIKLAQNPRMLLCGNQSNFQAKLWYVLNFKTCLPLSWLNSYGSM